MQLSLSRLGRKALAANTAKTIVPDKRGCEYRNPSDYRDLAMLTEYKLCGSLSLSTVRTRVRSGRSCGFCDRLFGYF
jgi:hypothetical protein